MATQLALLPGIKSKRIQPKRGQGKDFGSRKMVGAALFLGAGVQSFTMAMMAYKGVLPVPDVMLFADTKDEPYWVYQAAGFARNKLAERGTQFQWCHRDCYGLSAATSKQYGHRSISLPLWVKNADGTVGRLKRQCTDEFKVQPNNKALRSWLHDQGHASIRKDDALVVSNRVYVETWFGITTDEKLRASERGPGWQKTRYPLIEMGMSRDDCVQWLRDNGFPIPFKSACIHCPYRSDESWLWMQQNAPEAFEEACLIDDRYRTVEGKPGGVRGECYIHQSCKPLREIDFAKLVADRKISQASFFEVELLGDTCSSDGGFSCMS